jgi:hypothetical protein
MALVDPRKFAASATPVADKADTTRRRGLVPMARIARSALVIMFGGGEGLMGCDVVSGRAGGVEEIVVDSSSLAIEQRAQVLSMLLLIA